MNIEQIIKLIDAGYTKEEIGKMNQPAPAAPAAKPAQEPAAESKPEPVQKPKPEEKKPEEKKPDSEPVNEKMLQELQDLKKAVYAMNIMNSSQPEQRETVDDILARALKEG